MGYDYNKLYGETRDALGQPSAVFVAFFDQCDQQNLRVLDVGCGQGRDALFMARKGHRVVGVDISTNGIRDLLQSAEKDSLPIEGVVADIELYTPDGMFDVIVIDRTLHMLSGAKRVAVLGRLLDHVGDAGWMLIADEASNIKEFEAVVSSDMRRWKPHTPGRGYLFLQRC